MRSKRIKPSKTITLLDTFLDYVILHPNEATPADFGNMLYGLFFLHAHLYEKKQQHEMAVAVTTMTGSNNSQCLLEMLQLMNDMHKR